ncbi:menaquinone biosynthesis protein [Peptococcaceae bacterium 1198_IL3148]
MAELHLGQVDYINCIMPYHAFEEGQLPLDAKITKASPTRLKQMFLEGKLDITPLSAIEYARYADRCYIFPNMSISANGKADNVVLLSRVPVTELEGQRVAITSLDTTANALLKILFEHYYHVEVNYLTMDTDLDNMLAHADAVLQIGDDAMIANQRVKNESLPYIVTDLGRSWKEFTGEKMVFSIWCVRRDFAQNNPEKATDIIDLFSQSKLLGAKQLPTLVDIARRKIGLPPEVLEEYFHQISHEFDDQCRHALITFYDYAYKSGLIEERVKLNIWGENIG